MQYVTSGLINMPQDLTRSGVLALVTHDFNLIKDKLFVL